MWKACQVKNEYLVEARAKCRLVYGWGETEKIDPSLGKEQDTKAVTERDYLTHYYGWPIPTEEAIMKAVDLAPIVEVGAGGGYWASLIREADGDVIAYDIATAGKSDYSWKAWTEVEQGDEYKASDHPDRTLFMSWPLGSNLFAEWVLEAYNGDDVIYVGEHEGGSCATTGFFAMLQRDFNLVEEVDIPRYFGYHDYMSIWSRS
jgi:hypothetical protein